MWAKINKDNDDKIYCGLCETAFKERYDNGAKSFINERSSKKRKLWKIFDYWKIVIRGLALIWKFSNNFMQNLDIIIVNCV